MSMKPVSVYIEYPAMALNQAFTYLADESARPGCRVRVDFNGRTITGMITNDVPDADRARLKPVLSIVDESPLLSDELEALARFIEKEYVSSLMSVYKVMLPPALRPMEKRAAVAKVQYFVLGKSPQGKLTPKQQEAFEANKADLPLPAAEFRRRTRTLWKGMLEKGWIEKEERAKNSQPFLMSGEDTHFALSDEQKAAIARIESTDKPVSLLHGVTGSGKTEVFLQLAQKQLEAGRQVLFLVPEIGLTPLMIRRVTARFGAKVAIYHSGLSPQEKYSQYMAVKNGEVSIVVGTRSACFMPFSDLGLILMDEEHDTSYKQDSMPRYHTRDVVEFRAHWHKCKAVLASATPSLESYARAYKNVYELVELKKRVTNVMPAIEFGDLRQEGMALGFSNKLIHKMQERLARHEQIVLLLNRRGYDPVIRCRSCGEVIVCEDCGIPMNYHKSDHSLHCHTCGFVIPFRHQCPKCGSTELFTRGAGTEKVEDYLHKMFPRARVVRMDADSTRAKNAHEKLLAEFEAEGDILLGTQMVAKGLDFPRVTLVGILNADASLARMDYRQAENAYALLEQASGRAGRAEQPGEVVIQTFDPDHYVMQAVLHHNYRQFFAQEMKYRHMGNYPPYCFLCTLLFVHEDELTALKSAQAAKEFLSGLRVLGPISISLRMKRHRIRLVVKDASREHLRDTIWALSDWHKQTKQKARLEINMHPLGLEE